MFLVAPGEDIEIIPLTLFELVLPRHDQICPHT